MKVGNKKRKHDTNGSAASGIWQSIRSRLFLPGILSSAEATSNNAEANTNNDVPQKEETNAAKQRKVCTNNKAKEGAHAGIYSASASMITPEKSACGDKPSKPAQDGLIPRITEQMDLADLKVEAWERGYAAPDDSTRSDLLAYLHVGSICISSIKQMARQELLELEPGSSERLEQEASVGAIFLQHGLEYYNLNDMFGNLAFASKSAREYCMASFEAECRQKFPALMDGIARSKSSDTGGRVMYGRAVRFSMPVHANIGKPWDFAKAAEEDGDEDSYSWAHLTQNVDALLQLENGHGNVLAHAAVPLEEGDIGEPNVNATASCPHFEFDVPLVQSIDGLPEELDDASTEYKSLWAAAEGQRCADCGNATCMNMVPTLAARVVFRHKQSGKMAAIVTNGRFQIISNELEDGPVGSYVLTFDNSFRLDDDRPGRNIMFASLCIRVYSDQVKGGADRLKFSTRPFSHSPDSDPALTNAPSTILERGRLDESVELSFSIWVGNSHDWYCDEALLKGMCTRLLWC